MSFLALELGSLAIGLAGVALGRRWLHQDKLGLAFWASVVGVGFCMLTIFWMGAYWWATLA